MNSAVKQVSSDGHQSETTPRNKIFQRCVDLLGFFFLGGGVGCPLVALFILLVLSSHLVLGFACCLVVCTIFRFTLDQHLATC